MFQNNRIDLTCFSWDKTTYEKLGFVSQNAPNARPVIHMVHRAAGCGIMSMLLECGEHGCAFHGNTEVPSFTFAADGKRSTIVQALVASRMPVVCVRDDGSLMGYERAIEYCDILATVKDRMRAAREAVSMDESA